MKSFTAIAAFAASAVAAPHHISLPIVGELPLPTESCDTPSGLPTPTPQSEWTHPSVPSWPGKGISVSAEFSVELPTHTWPHSHPTPSSSILKYLSSISVPSVSSLPGHPISQSSASVPSISLPIPEYQSTPCSSSLPALPTGSHPSSIHMPSMSVPSAPSISKPSSLSIPTSSFKTSSTKPPHISISSVSVSVSIPMKGPLSLPTPSSVKPSSSSAKPSSPVSAHPSIITSLPAVPSKPSSSAKASSSSSVKTASSVLSAKASTSSASTSCTDTWAEHTKSSALPFPTEVPEGHKWDSNEW